MAYEMPRERFKQHMTEYQKEVVRAFDLHHEIREFYLEWARRHRKTSLAINLLCREATQWPKTKWLYIAPTKVECRDIVWDDPTMLREALPHPDHMGCRTNEQHMTVKFDNGSIIEFGGGDDPDSLRGIDAHGVVFDEWAMHNPRCWTEVMRPVMASKPMYEKMRRWAMFLYTPKGINHATQMFDAACCLNAGGSLPDAGMAKVMAPGKFASRVDAEVVGFIDKKELDLIKNDPLIPREFYDQEFRCARTTDEQRCLIPSSVLERLRHNNWKAQWIQREECRKIVSCDPAFGGDMCAIMGIEDGQIQVSRLISPGRTSEILFETKQVMSAIATKNAIVDVIGIGKGVSDGLTEDAAGYNVQAFNSSEKSNDERCQNRRAEAYFHASNTLRSGRCAPILDKELVRQLPIASRYRVTTGGKVLIQLKDIIRKELGCSPDLSDAFVMGLYGLQYVEPESIYRKTQYYDEEESYKRLLEMVL